MRTLAVLGTFIVILCACANATALDAAASAGCPFEIAAMAGPPTAPSGESDAPLTAQREDRISIPANQSTGVSAIVEHRIEGVASPSTLLPRDSAVARPSGLDVFAEEYRFVDTAGRVQDRAHRTADHLTLGSGCDAVHRYGTVAIVITHDGEVRLLRVWVQRNARWRVAAEQAVTIQPGAADPPPFSPPPTFQEAPSLDSPRDSVVADVLRAQDALDRANVMRDPGTFARLTHADFVVVTTHGLLRTKADRLVEERIAQLERQPERPLPRRDDLQVHVFGSAAIVTARNWPRTFEGAPRPPTRYTRVWIKGRAGWQQVANISTLVTSD